jgi:hypothetical protein
MRKFMVGLMVGGLLAVAVPATAQVQQAGIGDPLTLAASGVMIPFLGGPGDISLLEVASPVGDNGGLHMFFFDAACARIGDSVGLPLTTNDIGFVQIPNIVAGSGLVTVAQTDASGFNLLPLESPIHSRVYVFNTASARSRVLEPIILDTAEFAATSHTWSPLRTAATFYAPQQTATVETNLLFICPSRNIQGNAGAAFPTTSGFPVMAPPFAAAYPADMLRARIYNTNEVFLRDVRTTCACLRTASVLDISNVYSTADAVLGTYTEVESNAGSTAGDFAFTGYKATATVNSPVNNFVGRFSNGSRNSVQGILTNAR